jgi:TPR repeat protein
VVLIVSDWRKTLLFIVVIAFAGSALAGPAEDLATGYDAYIRGDYALAAEWFQKAAVKGNATAQDSLGVMYANGEGVQHDYVLAFMWFEIALENVPHTDAHWRSRLAQFKAASAAHLTPAQIAEAQHMARGWKSQIQFKLTSP